MKREELIDTYGEEICKYCIETYLSDTNFPLGESCEGSHCESAQDDYACENNIELEEEMVLQKNYYNTQNNRLS